jgi:integral membrane protein (TIGR01906 family)
MAEAVLTSTAKTKSTLAAQLMRLYLTLMLPVLLVLISARLMMTPLFLQIEYTRPSFPADYYGFTTQDRLNYAPYALNYLLNGEDIDYLGDLKFPDGAAMYNVRELQHMRDVKLVTQYAFMVAISGGVFFLAIGFILWRSPSTRIEWYRGLFNGGVLTLSLIAAIVVGAVVSWDVFFTGFHTLFFEGDSWRFAWSDTLIRLFPEQFWFDAALTIGGITVTAALLILFLSWRKMRRA